MKTTKHSPIILLFVIFLLILLPALVYLAVTQQSLFREAAPFSEATVNLIASTDNIDNVPIGNIISVDVHINAGTTPVSAAKIAIVYNKEKLYLNNVIAELGDDQAFTDMLYNPDTSPDTFTLLALKPTNELKTGNNKVATLRFRTLDTATDNEISIDATASEVVGFNDTSEDVEMTVQSGTTITYSIIGSLCSIEQCTTTQQISLEEKARQDDRLSVEVSWDGPTVPNNPTLYYKVYRAVNETVNNIHSELNPIIVTTRTEFVDSNAGGGFAPGSTINYDIDTYVECADPTATATPVP